MSGGGGAGAGAGGGWYAVENKTDILICQKLGVGVLLQFWRPRRCFYNFGAEGAFFLINFGAFRRFLLTVLAPKALFIINFGAEGAFYCQRRFVKTLCIVL